LVWFLHSGGNDNDDNNISAFYKAKRERKRYIKPSFNFKFVTVNGYGWLVSGLWMWIDESLSPTLGNK